MQVTNWGAAGEVTGSQHLIQSYDHTILLDCGLFQSSDWQAASRNYGFGFPAADVDAVFLSHAHIDHCGNLPALVKRGFEGPIYCSQITADLAGIMLEDGFRILEETTRRALQSHDDVDPETLLAALPYSLQEVRRTIELFQPLDMNESHELSGYLRARLLAAGHIPGASIIELDIDEPGGESRIIFSGDLGRRQTIDGPAPETVGHCDLLICESTYADRTHPDLETAIENLGQIIRNTVEQGGRVVIPAFSLGRSQQLLKVIGRLEHAGAIPQVPVFVDSPLARRVREALERFEVNPGQTESTSMPASYEYVSSVQESCAINDRDDPLIVISASGMCEAGRIQHHLRHSLHDESSSIVCVGFQAAGTLGRRLVEGAESVQIHGFDLDVRCAVHRIDGLSAHADQRDLEWWLSAIGDSGGANFALAVHGEEPSLLAMQQLLHPIVNESAVTPVRGQALELQL